MAALHNSHEVRYVVFVESFTGQIGLFTLSRGLATLRTSKSTILLICFCCYLKWITAAMAALHNSYEVRYVCFFMESFAIRA